MAPRWDPATGPRADTPAAPAPASHPPHPSRGRAAPDAAAPPSSAFPQADDGGAGTADDQAAANPARSTLRWKRSPSLPPRTAPIRVTTRTATRATIPAVVAVPSSTGMRGRFSWESTLYFAPATAPTTAR